MGVRRDPAEFWLSRVSVNSRRTYDQGLRLFLRWLNRHDGWVGVGAAELLERQRGAKDPYLVLDLLQEFVSGMDRSRRGKVVVYSSVRSFSGFVTMLLTEMLELREKEKRKS